jgi:glycosyltransferase involved in cell wall biosynthesis
MKVAIVIPTYKRVAKLERCLNSIRKQTYKEHITFIYADNEDFETSKAIKVDYPECKVNVNLTHKYVSGSWNTYFLDTFKNHVLPIPDIMAWIVDDVVLQEDCLANAVACMIKNFPDTDGIVGLKQTCPGRPDYTFKWFGQMLIGRKFIERYKPVNYKLYCLDYKHFHGTEEIFQYADSLGKFVNCPEASLEHYHPAFNSEWRDKTHDIVRSEIITKDKATWQERQQRQLVWGKTWELINEN